MLAAEHSHGVEATPNIVAGSFGSTAKHALCPSGTNAVVTLDDRFGAGAAGARVGGYLIAESQKTGDTRGDPAGHDLFHHCAAKTPNAAGIDQGDDPLADGVEPPDTGSENGAHVPIEGRVVLRVRPLVAGVGPRIDRRDAAKAVAGISITSSVRYLGLPRAPCSSLNKVFKYLTIGFMKGLTAKTPTTLNIV